MVVVKSGLVLKLFKRPKPYPTLIVYVDQAFKIQVPFRCEDKNFDYAMMKKKKNQLTLVSLSMLECILCYE